MMYYKAMKIEQAEPLRKVYKTAEIEELYFGICLFIVEYVNRDLMESKGFTSSRHEALQDAEILSTMQYHQDVTNTLICIKNNMPTRY